MHVSILAVFGVFPLLFSVLIWAVPEADGPGPSHSGQSLDEIIALMTRALPTHLRGDEDLISVHKGSITQGMSQYLSSEYPRKNILIYHDQNSTFQGVNAVHRAVGLTSDNGNDEQHTYEIQIFDTGTFTLAGEGGHHNWAFVGNWSQNGNSVNFFPLEESSAMYRSGRSPARLGGVYLPPSAGDAGLGTRDRGQPWWTDPVPAREANPAFEADLVDNPEWDAVTESEMIFSIDGDIIEGSAVLGPEATAAVMAIIVITIAAVLFGEMFAEWAHKKHKERTFTQSTVTQHASAVTSKNVIVFHDQDSTVSFVNWAHTHHELSLGGIAHDTQGFEIYSFDYGNFTLSGDGGFENWAFSGNFDWPQGSSTVTFYPRPGNNCHAAALKDRDASERQVRLRRPNPPRVPSREDPAQRDGHYFVTCVKPDSTLSLGIAYYEDMDPWGSNIGQSPDDFVVVHSNLAGVHAWEGEGHATFGTGERYFHWNFMRQSWEDDLVVAGSANTAFEQFWVYKDAGALLFNTTANWACNSLYYAF